MFTLLDQEKLRLPYKDWQTLSVVIIFMLSIIFRVWVSSPVWLHYDENYYINIAQNYEDRGELTPYMWRLGSTNIIAGGGSGYGILLLMYMLQLVGNSLFLGRLLMVFIGVCTAVILYYVSSIWWRSRVAGVAALLYGLVGTSPFYTMIVKMDAIGIFFYSLLLLLHIQAVRLGKWYLHLLLGVASVLAVEFHVLGMIYLGAFGIYYALSNIKEILTARRFFLSSSTYSFFSGAFTSGLVYLIIHVMPDPEAYFLISQECFECNDPIIKTEVIRIVRLLVLRPIEVFLFMALLIVVIKRNRTEDQHYLILTVGYILGQAITGVPPYSHYANHFWPIMALGIGGLAVYGSKKRLVYWWYPTGLALALAILVSNLVFHLLGSHPYLLSYSIEKIDPAINFVVDSVPKETSIMGKVDDFYTLRTFKKYVSYRDGTEYGTRLRGESILDFWHEVKPEIILIDNQVVKEDTELIKYISYEKMEQVMPGLWMRREFFENLENIQNK